MGDWASAIVGSGAMVLALPVALLAGLVSFFSPCVVPLLPGYLAYATGMSAAEIGAWTAGRGRMLAGTALFVAGFATVFVAAGAGVKPGTRLGVIENVDVAPTVARLLGVALPDADGEPLDEILEPDTGR